MKQPLAILIMLLAGFALKAQTISSLSDERIPEGLQNKIFKHEYAASEKEVEFVEEYNIKDPELPGWLNFELTIRIDEKGKITGILHRSRTYNEAGGKKSLKTVELNAYTLDVSGGNNIFCCKSKPDVCTSDWQDRKNFACDVWVIRR